MFSSLIKIKLGQIKLNFSFIRVCYIRLKPNLRYDLLLAVYFYEVFASFPPDASIRGNLKIKISEIPPQYPEVYDNSAEAFVWGFKKSILRANHVFIFESINNGKGTRLVHYEKMSGFLKAFVMTKKTKANMFEKYNTMNQSFKSFCEKTL